jgi:hypothetical protein
MRRQNDHEKEDGAKKSSQSRNPGSHIILEKLKLQPRGLHYERVINPLAGAFGLAYPLKRNFGSCDTNHVIPTIKKNTFAPTNAE